jgi:hypothetical protein
MILLRSLTVIFAGFTVPGPAQKCQFSSSGRATFCFVKKKCLTGGFNSHGRDCFPSNKKPVSQMGRYFSGLVWALSRILLMPGGFAVCEAFVGRLDPEVVVIDCLA